MKKFVAGIVALKLIILISLVAFMFSGYQNFSVSSQTKPQPTTTPTNDSIDRPTSDPYKGDLSRYDDRENRAEDLQIDKVMNLLQIKEGKAVADIGAGGGWFSAIASKRVGDKGIVYAVDINDDAIKYINDRKIKENLTNVLAVLGKEDDPFLPSNSVDAVLLLNKYHEVAEPIKLLKNLKKSLKKNALVGIIDRNGEGDDHGIARETIIKEAETAGFELKESHTFVEDGMDYFLIFRVSEIKKPKV